MMGLELLRSERDFSAWVVSGTPAVVCGIAPDGRTTFINPSGERITGYRAQEIIGKNWWRVFYPGDEYRQVSQLFLDFKSGDVRNYEMTLTTKHGKKRLISWNSVNRSDETGTTSQVIGIGRDITEHKQMEEKLEQALEKVRTLSLTDDLTKLHNRRGFLALAGQQLKMADRNNKETALLFGDLDNMKRINDTWGHQEGDLALIEVAHILRQTFRESDIIARVGGDEFAVLAIETSSAGAQALLTRFERNLEAHHVGANHRPRLSMSVGIACYNRKSPCSMYELMSKADKMMYEEKRAKQGSLV